MVWDGDQTAGPAGTAADIAVWEHAGLARIIILVGKGYRPAPAPPLAHRDLERRPRAMLFGDTHRFRGLRDDQLPRFIKLVLGCFARVVKGCGSDILFADTWGDGLSGVRRRHQGRELRA